MSTITLMKPSQPEVTVLSNIFIDHYMPEANGEFVKVYIYLLRTLSSAPVSFALEQMADQLLCTERDILRALKYWNKCGLLSMNYTKDQELASVSLLPPDSPRAAAEVSSPAEKAGPGTVFPAEQTVFRTASPAEKAALRTVSSAEKTVFQTAS